MAPLCELAFSHYRMTCPVTYNVSRTFQKLGLSVSGRASVQRAGTRVPVEPTVVIYKCVICGRFLNSAEPHCS